MFRPLNLLGKNPAPMELGHAIFELEEVDGARGRGAVLLKAGLELAQRSGQAMHDNARRQGYKTRDGVEDVTKSIRGCAGEIAWWIASGFKWTGLTELLNIHRLDCEHTEVRGVFSISLGQRMGAWAYMPLMERDKPDIPHIVAAPLRHNLKLWWFHGWYTPREASKHDDWWHEKQFKNCGGWRVQCVDMYDLELLKVRNE